MHRAAKLRSSFAVAATILCVSVAYEIKEKLPSLSASLGWASWLIWVAGVALTIFLATGATALLWNISVRFRFVRRFLLGELWIEGVWFFQTAEHHPDGRKVTQVGLAHFSYNIPTLELHGQFASVCLDTGDLIQTERLNILVDDDLRYVHRFIRHFKDAQSVGAAFGCFVGGESKAPVRYEGEVIFAEDSRDRRQIGTKLSRKEVKELSKQGAGWQYRILRNQEWVNAHLLVSSTTANRGVLVPPTGAVPAASPADAK